MATLAPEEEDVSTPTEFSRGVTLFRLFRMIGSYGRELCFVLAVLFTAYAAFQSSPLQTRKAKFPQTFFSENSLVTDYFWGHVSLAFEKIQHSDVTFIMYYAPWDAASMDARWEFEKTAKYYHEQVCFLAVNCWWPEGECRSRFPKIQSYPILIAYQNNGKGVQFHGNVAFPDLVRFLDQVINPLVVIHSRSELYQLLARRDAVVLGYFKFDGLVQPSGFASYYIGALKALERDPLGTIKFALISNAIDASKFGMSSSKSVHLYLWNSTLSFVTNETFSSQKLLNWVFEKKTEAVKMLAPPGVKSLLLSSFLEYSPTLIMLTPRYSTSSLKTSPFYYMLKEIALDYLNCNSSSSQIGNIISSIRMELQDLKQEKESSRSCSGASESRLEDKFCVCAKSDSSTDDNMIRSVCSSDRLALRDISVGSSYVDGCVSVRLWHPLLSTISVCHHPKGAAVPPSHQISQKSALDSQNRYDCMLLNHSRVEPELHLPGGSGSGGSKKNFTGSGCLTNATLNFVVMDSLSYSLFFEKLGIDVSSKATKTAVAIVHVEQELHYSMIKDVTYSNLREFINDFTGGRLRRHHRSGAVSTVPPRPTENQIILQEITSSNFDEIVMDVKKDVVLLVYAPWCAFCYGIAHIYLAAARYFSSAEDIIFARLNGDANDLPWEFTVQKYPTIMLLPAHRKANSLSFPEEVPVTTTNLINFVLSNCKQEIRMRMALSLCNHQCIINNQKLTLKKIHKLLHRYRTLDGRLMAAGDVLEGRCHSANLSEEQQRSLVGHVDYVRHLVQEMCRSRIQLTHAKTLHLVLSTTKGNHLTWQQLNEITQSHQTFATDLILRECKDLVSALKRRLRRCATWNDFLVE